ncbi:hypothetical protein [Nocardiopsis suaedae]|uniref:Uncharacterized protein n=1 Tax=Nocardiopsis suaedae TaxID=3018444 RepID=A0ABT4TXK0_9ACTN|nr:hypothetical protein [Nocardiopsis suaedae]MDA2808985.1 hypothetical protein [Nocardiopsis suaedae]
MTQAHEVPRILERLRAEHGQAWRISASMIRVGRERRLQWSAERPWSPAPQVVRTRTAEELDTGLNFHHRLDEVRRAYGDTWVIGCQVKEEGVPCWAWAQRKERLASPVENAFSAPTPEELEERLSEARRRERLWSIA